MLTMWTMAAMTAAWLAVYACAKLLIRRLLATSAVRRRVPDAHTRDVLASQGPAYLVSAIHALYVTPRGVQHLLRLWHAPLPFKLLAPRGAALASALQSARLRRHVDEIERVMLTNLTLSGYLCADMLLVLSHFPHLGGLDIVAHHVAFLFCGAVAGYFRLYPFTFGWLIVGEASTPLLDLRWLLIKLGLGHTRLFAFVQMAFGLVFVTTRFFVYGAGLAYHLSMMLRMPDVIPRWAVTTTSAFVVLGFFLNFMWLSKIAKIALGKSHKKRPPAADTSPQPAEGDAAAAAARDSAHEKDD